MPATRSAPLALSTSASKPYSYNFGTRAIHIGSDPSAETGAVIPPISLSTTFKQDSVGVHKGYEYSRSDNPNRRALEAQLAALESGKHALAFASGSAATSTVLTAVGPNSHIISVNDVYGGTYRYMVRVAKELSNVEVTWLDLENATEEAILSSIKDNTKLLWIETPTNPTLRIIDIPYIASVLSSHPNKPLLLVDNTFMSPYFQSPLLLGADVVLHSITKYINGHSDVVMGALILPEPTPSSKPALAPFISKLRFLQNAMGNIPSPHDAWLAQRGAKTLHLRMKAHGINALSVARALERAKSTGLVKDVTYPGLRNHPRFHIAWEKDISHQAKTWVRSLKGSVIPGLGLEEEGRGYDPELDGIPFGGMISFRIATPSTSDPSSTVAKFLKNLKLFALAESLGGVESLVEVPAQMTHGSIPESERAILGITDDLIRMSIGVEDAEDLVRDILDALEVAVHGESSTSVSPSGSSDILLETGPSTTPISEDDSPLASRIHSGAPSEAGDRPSIKSL